MLKSPILSIKDYQGYDSITGVLNRESFLNKLNATIEDKCTSNQYIFGVANIERFKLINHSYGYGAGDYCLNILAKTMSLELNSNTIIGRLGNDEFGFICRNKNITQIQSRCESLNYSLNYAPVTWNESKIRLHIKFGLVNITNEIQDCDQILRHVNEAIYSAQYDGCPTVCEYDSDDTAILRRSGNMQEAIKLQRCVTQDQFKLYVQPIVFLNNPEKTSHYELLLRGQSDDGEIISPGKLIDAAEDFNLTPMLDKWVIRSLFAWIKQANSPPFSNYKFSFNLSALSINDNDLSQYIINLAHKENINPRKISIELTERVAISNIKRCYDFMTVLKKEGFTFSLDDFGSGYSSFKYIQLLPFDVIKIDGEFIKDIDINEQNQIIVKAVSDIAKAYGRKTVAEYIENKNIATTANEIGIDFGQGYYFSKPFPITELSDI